MSNITILAYHIRHHVRNLMDYRGRIGSARLEQLSHFRPENQIRSLCGDLLVLECLKAHNNTLTLPLQYTRAEFGKPYLPLLPNFHFNVSHSGNWVLCATGSIPLGVDIQEERIFKPALLRILSTSEKVFWDSVSNNQKASTLFDFWCLKEAYCKATGQGLRLPLNSFSVSLFPPSLSDKSCCIKPIASPVNNYHIGLCVKGTVMPPVELKIVAHIE